MNSGKPSWLAGILDMWIWWENGLKFDTASNVVTSDKTEFSLWWVPYSFC